jgi:isopentenyldiphosphate isomerase
LFGREFDYVDDRERYGLQRVYYHRADGTRVYFPTKWTNLAAPDPFLELARGEAIARLSDLLGLADLVRALREGSVKENTPEV